MTNKEISIFGYNAIVLNHQGNLKLGIKSDGTNDDFLKTLLNTAIKYANVNIKSYLDQSEWEKVIRRVEYNIDYFDFNFNANVRQAGSTPTISIKGGCIIALADIFLAVSTHSDFFKEWKFEPESYNFSLSREGTLNKDFFNYTPKGGTFKFINDFISDFPVCNKRIKLAELLTFIGYNFIIDHEIGHFVRGHLEFADANKEGKVINELEDFNEKNISLLVRKALEHQADQFAMRRVFDLIMINPLWRLIPYKELHNNIEEFRIMLIGTCTVFLLFEKKLSLNNRDNPKYPSPTSRMINFLINFMEVYLVTRPVDDHLIKDAMGEEGSTQYLSSSKEFHKVVINPLTGYLGQQIIHKFLLDMRHIYYILQLPMPNIQDVIDDVCINIPKKLKDDSIQLKLQESYESYEIIETEKIITIELLKKFRNIAVPEHEEILRQDGLNELKKYFGLTDELD